MKGNAISAVSTRDAAGLRKPGLRRCTRQAAARAHMHTGPAGACAWAHPRWGRAAEQMLGALPVFGCGADMVGPHPVQVVREQALRERSGVEEAPSLGAAAWPPENKKARFLGRDRASNERGRERRLAGSFTR